MNYHYFCKNLNKLCALFLIHKITHEKNQKSLILNLIPLYYMTKIILLYDKSHILINFFLSIVSTKEDIK